MESDTQHPSSTILAYCGVLCFVPLLLHKENTFVLFHAKQGIALFILECIAVFLASSVLGAALSILLFVACGLGAIAGILTVLKGQKKQLPLLHWMVEKLNI
jgi:uncharacterized membrane protein